MFSTTRFIDDALVVAAQARRASHLLLMTILLSLGLFATNTKAQLTGTQNIPGSYPTLAAAITDLNTVGVGAGGVILNVVAGNPQVAPAGGYVINTNTSSATATALIRGNGNVITASSTHVVGSLTDAIFKIVGSDSITIRGFSMIESAANTVTAPANNTMTEWGIALLNASLTNGPQAASLLLNSIDLDRNYNNSIGIYSNANHSSTNSLALAPANSLGGAHSNLSITRNTISGVAHGIAVVGSNLSLAHTDTVTIGGNNADANTITNFGNAGLSSVFAGLFSAQTNGILLRNCKNFNVSFNALSSATAAPLPTANLLGVHVGNYVNAITGTHTNNISSNTFNLSNTNKNMFGIAMDANSDSSGSTLQVNNNRFLSATLTIGQSANFIALASRAQSRSIDGNQFENLTDNSVGNTNFMINSLDAGLTASIKLNQIVGNYTKGASASQTIIYRESGSATGFNVDFSNNNFSNLQINASGGFFGFTDPAVGASHTLSNNSFINITQAAGHVVVLDLDNTSANATPLFTVDNNIIRDIEASLGDLTGILSGTTNNLITNNTISDLRGLSGLAPYSTVIGIAQHHDGESMIDSNRIFDFQGSGIGAKVVAVQIRETTAPPTGAYVNSTRSVSNNLIADMRAPNTSGNNLAAFDLQGELNNTVVAHNTVLLTATGATAGFRSAVVNIAPPVSGFYSSGVLFVNNSFTNLSTPGASGYNTIFEVSNENDFVNIQNDLSDNNNYYAGAPSALNLILHSPTTQRQSLVDYQTVALPADRHNITESPTFISTLGSNVDFLHLNTITPSQHESAGLAFPGVVVDVDNQARNATTPDIGADEFSGVSLDLTKPIIDLTALPQRITTQTQTLNVMITDRSGIAISPLAPRLYFRKNANAYVSVACTLATAPNFICTMTPATAGGFSIGDVIQYFVIAQDVFGNVISNPLAGLVASSVSSVTTPPTSPLQTTVAAAISAAVTVGSAGTYASISNAGGLFDAINQGVLNANVIASINSDLANETGLILLNAYVVRNSGDFDVEIRPVGNRVINVGNKAISSNARLRINGLGTSGNRFIFRSIDCANALFPNAMISVLSDGSKIINSELEDCRANSLGFYIVGDNLELNNNIARVHPNLGAGRASTSLFMIGSGSVRNNVLNAASQSAIRVSSFSGAGVVIENNDISQISTHGILIDDGRVPIEILSNDLLEFSQAGAIGITFDGYQDGVKIAKNKIIHSGVTPINGNLTGILADATLWFGDGIFRVENNMLSITQNNNAGSVIGLSLIGAFEEISHNSIFIGGNGNSDSSAIQLSNPESTVMRLRNNVFFNARTSVGAFNNFAAIDTGTNSNINMNFNRFKGSSNAGSTFFKLAGTPVNLATWRLGPPARDANSSLITATLAAFFVNANIGDLHLQAGATEALNVATPLATITTDIDGETRSTSTPEIGADEVLNTPPSITAAPAVNLAWGSSFANPIALASVNDLETSAGSLTVTAIAGGTAAGYTIGSIINTNGSVSAPISAACGATPGTQRLQVSDGQLTATADLQINGVADPNPVLIYPNQTVSVALNGNTTVTPMTGPSDNGGVASITVFSVGSFTGNITVNSTTGVVTISNAAPLINNNQITIQITDNCGNTSTGSFLLSVGGVPTTTTITTRPSLSSVTGEVFVASVSVNGTSAPNPPATGNVQLNIQNCSVLNNCNQNLPLVNGVANFNLVGVNLGNTTITASYQGNSDFQISLDTETHTVNQAATQIVLSGPATARVNDNAIYSFILQGSAPSTGSPTGIVTITSGDSTCQVTVPNATPNCILEFLTPGSRNVSASFAPSDGNYSASNSNTVVTNALFFSDLSITNTNSVTGYGANEILTYTMQVRNLGPDIANGVRIQNIVPTTLINPTWTCTASAGAPCNGTSGIGNLDMTVGPLFVNATIVLTLTAQVNGAPAQVNNTATVSFANGNNMFETNTSNDSASDLDNLTIVFRDGFE